MSCACFALILCLLGSYTNSVFGSSNRSFEHLIRAHLLKNYDKKVLPIVGRKLVEVSFTIQISRLVKVDNKAQIVSVDSWVRQSWANKFLQWNKNDFGDSELVQFSPDEIWVPDITLFNNGDEDVSGGMIKYGSVVSVDYHGRCTWRGPATLKASCELEFSKWPFDNQTCDLGFGSYSYGIDRMAIKQDTNNRGQKFTDRFVSNGEWKINEITTSLTTTDHGACCPFNFSEVVYSLKITRKPLYLLFYLSVPSLILTFLSLTSFLIPVESGERIGFVTTMLLAMTVFLLLIPSFLPESSSGVPILGIGLQATMVIISMVLLSNIFVLKIFFMEGTPPEWVQKLFSLFHSKKRNHVSPSHISSADGQHLPAIQSLASVNVTEVSERPEGSCNAPKDWEGKGEELTWQKVSVKLDHVFFMLFLLIAVITFSVTYAA